MRTRREFLFDCSSAMAALAVAPSALAVRPGFPSRGLASLDQVSHPTLAALINTPFLVRFSPRRVVELQLLKAPLAPPAPSQPGRRPPGDVGNERFSLIFSGPEEQRIESGTYRFEHEQLGCFEMHLGPAGSRRAGRALYEAVFNRPSPRA